MNIFHKCNQAILIIALFIMGSSVYASPSIVILDFELIDITSLPNTPEELVRTASIKPLLEQAMSREGDYEIIQVSRIKQESANPGLGYLFRFHDVAAKLGKQFGADWIIVGQHSKPSFLYSHLKVHVINVKTAQLKAGYSIELKGNHEKVTDRGVKSLARKINELFIRAGE